jgi:O-antigen/teichoic acid export membrane protein
MKLAFVQWFKANRAIFSNAGSLIGTMGITSALGFVYWWLAARTFPAQEVGIASASISAMTLLGTIGVMGLGTLLITELPRQPTQTGSLISTAILVVSVVGGCIGLAFVRIAPQLSANFQPVSANLFTILLFGLGVSLTSITQVLDQATIGLLLGRVQFWRNGVFTLGKLIVLWLLSRWAVGTGGMGIYSAWTLGSIISLLALGGWVLRKKEHSGQSYWPRRTLLSKLGRAALQHHLLNLALAAPILILPVMVTVVLSAQANAWFYMSWMIANFLFVVPGALTMVLHAINSAQQNTLRYKARVTLGLSFAVSIAVNGVLLLGAPLVLNLFGHTYALQAAWALRILALGAFPLVIKNHYIAICRIHDRITQAMIGMAPGGLLELGLAALGAHLSGLAGLSAGWVSAMCIESLFMAPTVYRAVFGPLQDRQSSEHPERFIDPLWLSTRETFYLMDTAPLPVIGPDLLRKTPYHTAKQRSLRPTRLEPMLFSDRTNTIEQTQLKQESETEHANNTYKTSEPAYTSYIDRATRGAKNSRSG